MRRLFFTFLFSVAIPAFAFDILPEYQGISEGDLTKFESPVDVDSEYQTVFNAYDMSVESERTWTKWSSGFDGSLGSIGNKDFLYHGRMKLSRKLWEGLSFKFIYFTQRDREVDQVRHIFELTQKIISSWGLAVYADPSAYKRETDIGLAIEWLPTENWQNRFFYTLHDFARNDHNNLSDRFTADGKPRSWGWLGILENEDYFFRGGFRIDQQTVWTRPQENRMFRSHRHMAYLDALIPLSGDSAISSRSQWDNGEEKQESLDDPEENLEGWQLSRFKARLGYQSVPSIDGKNDQKFFYELAFTHSERKWRHYSGQRQSHFNELPSAMASWRAYRRLHGFDRMQVEYEFNFFNRYGDLQLSPTQQARHLEQRLQLGYKFSFTRSAFLLLAVNFDMDQWTPVPTFEGGNGTLQVEL